MEQAVDRALFAFSHAEQGDLFVEKAPAATMGDLAEVLRAVFGVKNEIRTIGTRHGEKLYETLLSREEAAKAQDRGRYYRVPADTRDLNYGMYFDEGDESITRAEEYNSQNATRLDQKALKKLLLSLDIVKEELRSA